MCRASGHPPQKRQSQLPPPFMRAVFAAPFLASIAIIWALTSTVNAFYWCSDGDLGCGRERTGDLDYTPALVVASTALIAAVTAGLILLTVIKRLAPQAGRAPLIVATVTTTCVLYLLGMSFVGLTPLGFPR